MGIPERADVNRGGRETQFGAGNTLFCPDAFIGTFFLTFWQPDWPVGRLSLA